jgi:hypothetical protein
MYRASRAVSAHNLTQLKVHFHVFFSLNFSPFLKSDGVMRFLTLLTRRSVSAQPDSAEASGQGGAGGDGQAGDSQQVRNTFYSGRHERLIGPDLFFYWFGIKKKPTVSS